MASRVTMNQALPHKVPGLDPSRKIPGEPFDLLQTSPPRADRVALDGEALKPAGPCTDHRRIVRRDGRELSRPGAWQPTALMRRPRILPGSTAPVGVSNRGCATPRTCASAWGWAPCG